MASEIVQYTADNGQDIQVTEDDVRGLLSAGGNDVSNVTKAEIMSFMRLCQAQRLNPFTRDAYLVKYGSSPATIIAGKETFTKRAQRNQRFRGFTAGITVIGTDGQMHRREGSMLLPREQLIGGWCKVYMEGYEAPMYDEVSFAEYTTGKSNWAKIPATMIRKVAICHALREAFPEDLGGLYGAEEMDQARQEQPAAQPRAVDAVVEDAAPEPQQSPLHAYKAALTRAKQERGIEVKDAIQVVDNAIGKPPEQFAAEDVRRAAEIVDGIPAMVEPEYEEVTEPEPPLAAEDIPF